MSNDNLEKIKSILNDYITSGEASNHRSYWDDQLDTVHNLMPRPKNSMMLYRALKLNKMGIAYLKENIPVELEPAKYTSWTKSKDYAVVFARGKGENTVIVAMHFQPESVTIDINDFYENNGILNDAYWRYVVKEAEVIVKMDEPLVLTSKNCIIVDDMDRYSGPAPKIGDNVYSDLSTNEDPIAVVADVGSLQPDAKYGIFEVEVDDGSFVQIQHTNGIWIEA